MKKTNAIRILDQRKITYDLLEYTYDSENLSVDKIAEANQLEVKTVFKTLVAKGDKTGIIIAVLPGTESLNLKSLAKYSNNKKIALIPVKDLQNLTGYIRGGCSPIGMKKDFPVFISTSALELKYVYINAGKRGLFIKIDTNDLVKTVDATVCEIGLL